jgi:hypothetical protein
MLRTSEMEHSCDDFAHQTEFVGLAAAVLSSADTPRLGRGFAMTAAETEIDTGTDELLCIIRDRVAIRTLTATRRCATRRRTSSRE